MFCITTYHERHNKLEVYLSAHYGAYTHIDNAKVSMKP